MTAKKKPEVWNIMTRTRGGTVSLLKNLTEEQARAAMQRLRTRWETGNPWDIPSRIYYVLNPQNMGGVYYPQDGDLEEITCWGPPGAKLVVWPKPAGWDAKYRRALAKARREAEAKKAAPEKLGPAPKGQPIQYAAPVQPEAPPEKPKARWWPLRKGLA